MKNKPMRKISVASPELHGDGTEKNEQMKKGYLEMGKTNVELAEEALLSDESACVIYEKFLSESE